MRAFGLARTSTLTRLVCELHRITRWRLLARDTSALMSDPGVTRFRSVPGVLDVAEPCLTLSIHGRSILCRVGERSDGFHGNPRAIYHGHVFSVHGWDDDKSRNMKETFFELCLLVAVTCFHVT